jgi:hypothetical protein
MCLSCERRAEDEVEERRQAELDGPCDDCGECKAESLFLHLDGRRFKLCDLCWSWADHEPDYLMYCECKCPESDGCSEYCSLCLFKIPSARVPEADYEDGFTFDFLDAEDDDGPPPPCDCPVPCKDVVNEGKCYMCKGVV